MGDDFYRTIRIQRNAKVGTDSHGRTVWTRPIEPAELELVSTMMLEQILHSEDEDKKDRVRALTEGDEGVLARDTSTGQFEIVRDEELEAALKAANSRERNAQYAELMMERVSEVDGEEEFSLVTTQMLRRILTHDDPESGPNTPDGDEGCDPYDSS